MTDPIRVLAEALAIFAIMLVIADFSTRVDDWTSWYRPIRDFLSDQSLRPCVGVTGEPGGNSSTEMGSESGYVGGKLDHGVR